MDHRGVAAVEATDPLRDRGRDGHEAVRRVRRVCRAAEARRSRAQREARRRRQAPLVGFRQPHVSHRRVAVTDVRGRLGRTHVKRARCDDEMTTSYSLRSRCAKYSGMYGADTATGPRRAHPGASRRATRDDRARERRRQHVAFRVEREDVRRLSKTPVRIASTTRSAPWKPWNQSCTRAVRVAEFTGRDPSTSSAAFRLQGAHTGLLSSRGCCGPRSVSLSSRRYSCPRAPRALQPRRRVRRGRSRPRSTPGMP